MRQHPFDLPSFYPSLFDDSFDEWDYDDPFYNPFYNYSHSPAPAMFSMFRRRKPQDASALQSADSPNPSATLQPPSHQNPQPSPRPFPAANNHSTSTVHQDQFQRPFQNQNSSRPGGLYPNLDELRQSPSVHSGTPEDYAAASVDGKYSTPASTPSIASNGGSAPAPLLPPGASFPAAFPAAHINASLTPNAGQQHPSSNSSTPNGSYPKPDNSPNGQLAQIRSSLDALLPKLKQFSGI